MAESQQPKTKLQQLEFFEIPSPCIGVCQANEKGFCKGCFRSREERLYWPQVDNMTKRVIIQACVRRKKRTQKPPKSVSVSPNQQAQLFTDDDTLS